MSIIDFNSFKEKKDKEKLEEQIDENVEQFTAELMELVANKVNSEELNLPAAYFVLVAMESLYRRLMVENGYSLDQINAMHGAADEAAEEQFQNIFGHQSSYEDYMDELVDEITNQVDNIFKEEE